MNSLYPFARKLAETMCRVEFKREEAPAAGCYVTTPGAHGWTQKEMQAILDRPRMTEPERPF